MLQRLYCNQHLHHLLALVLRALGESCGENCMRKIRGDFLSISGIEAVKQSVRDLQIGEPGEHKMRYNLWFMIMSQFTSSVYHNCTRSF